MKSTFKYFEKSGSVLRRNLTDIAFNAISQHNRPILLLIIVASPSDSGSSLT
jgi:hypothetical protein